MQKKVFAIQGFISATKYNSSYRLLASSDKIKIMGKF